MNDYQLIYEDDFLIDGKIDDSVWTHEVGEKWANNESQCYVDDFEHCYIKDSILHLYATYEEGDHCPFKSARIKTKDKLHFQYGKFVFRAKMPKGRGAWPAIWFLGNTGKERIPWPRCGEIDLLEFAGNRPNQVTCAIHTESYNHKIHTEKMVATPLHDASDCFHDYTLEWTKEKLGFFVDDIEVMTIKKEANDTFAEWPFDQPYYLIMNLAVGGWYAGKIAEEDLPFDFQIDSIKIYQKKD